MGYMRFPSLTLRPVLQGVEKHRLFIVFPAFLAILWLSVRPGMRAQLVLPQEPKNGVVLTAKDRPQTLVLGNEAVARALPGAILVDDESTPILSDGEAVIGSRSAFSVSVKGLTLTAWNGAIRIVRTDDATVIEALTTPILVSGSGGSALIPVRTQWTVPSDGMHTLEQGMQRWLTERSTSPIDADTLRIQLPVVVDLLGMDQSRPDIDAIHAFASTSTGWLLGAYHPLTRDLGWTLPRSDAETREQHLMSLVSFLPSDFLPEPVSSVAFDRWAQDLQDYLSVEDSVGVRVLIEEQAKAFDPETMPERSGRAGSVLE